MGFLLNTMMSTENILITLLISSEIVSSTGVVWLLNKYKIKVADGATHLTPENWDEYKDEKRWLWMKVVALCFLCSLLVLLIIRFSIPSHVSVNVVLLVPALIYLATKLSTEGLKTLRSFLQEPSSRARNPLLKPLAAGLIISFLLLLLADAEFRKSLVEEVTKIITPK